MELMGILIGSPESFPRALFDERRGLKYGFLETHIAATPGWHP